jgi:hypothetical protein
VWVQGQPGIGKSTIVKRMLTGPICFGDPARLKVTTAAHRM